MSGSSSSSDIRVSILPILGAFHRSFAESLVMLGHEDFLFSFLSYGA
jgi:hypothetical protein